MPDSIIHQPKREHRNKIITLENRQLKNVNQKDIQENTNCHPGGIRLRETQNSLKDRLQ